MQDILNNFGSELLNSFISFIIPIIISALFSVLTGVSYKLYKYVDAKLKLLEPNIYDSVKEFSKDAVHAAEQSFIAGLISDKKQKKQFAIDYVQRELNMRGWKMIDVEFIADKIESSLHSEINNYKDLVVNQKDI